MPRHSFLAALAGLAPLSALAAIIGTNPPALPLTADRINQLPAAEQPAWQKYLAASRAQRAKDEAFFKEELRAHGIKQPILPPQGRGGLALTRPAEWYASDEARTLADHVLSFQTPAGGWSKNLNFTAHARQPGELFAPANAAPTPPKPDDNDAPHDPQWHYVGTFDNDATTTQIRFLARVSSALGETAGEKYRAAWLRGLDYVFAAQFPNGGWPQIYPLEGGYHDAVTFNDDAMVHIVEFLRDVAAGTGDFKGMPQSVRARAATAVDRGIACILAAQIVVDGRLTVWCQQHDALTLAPTSARNYEMPSFSGAESGSIAIFLMSLPNPSPQIVRAVHAAAAWFEKTAVRDVSYRFTPATGRALIPTPGGGPLWARYYDLKTQRPIFGDRDKSIHDELSEISAERRNGYQWYGTSGARTLERYAEWKKAHPAT